MQLLDNASTIAQPISVLFVCMGNICRSPLAQLALTLEATAARLPIIADSAGTGDWHVGLPPDRRARAVAARLGHSIDEYQARQISTRDFADFDHIIALDRQILEDLCAFQPMESRAIVSLLLDHVPGREGEDVFDPYYRDEVAFLETWGDVSTSARALVAMFAAQTVSR